jgi:hypothetical protein
MRARSPTKLCRVCKLPPSEAGLINGGLSAGWSPRRLSARFGTVTRRDITNHARKCGKDKGCR